MRRTIVLTTVIAMLLAVAAPAGARRESLRGPDPAVWLSDPDGDDGDSGIEQFDPVDGARGFAVVGRRAARIAVRTTGLAPRHTYTMWIVYFNDATRCEGDEGCNGADFDQAGAGVVYGTGRIASSNGTARFAARLRAGEGSDVVGNTPPPPFATAAYEPGPHNEFHVVLRSHGPIIPGQVVDQLTTFNGGCEVQVGPPPEQVGDFPVPSAAGECGDVQLHVFS